MAVQFPKIRFEFWIFDEALIFPQKQRDHPFVEVVARREDPAKGKIVEISVQHLMMGINRQLFVL